MGARRAMGKRQSGAREERNVNIRVPGRVAMLLPHGGSMLGIGRHRTSEAVMLQGREWCVCSRKPRVGLTGANSGERQGGVCGLRPGEPTCARVRVGLRCGGRSALCWLPSALLAAPPARLLARYDSLYSLLSVCRIELRLSPLFPGHIDSGSTSNQAVTQACFNVRIEGPVSVPYRSGAQDPSTHAIPRAAHRGLLSICRIA